MHPADPLSPIWPKHALRYPDPEDFFFFKLCYLGYFRFTKKTTLTTLDSSGEAISIESGTVRVVSLSTMEYQR